MQRYLLSTFIYIKGPLEYKKYSKCKAGMFGVFALDLKAIYFIVLEDLISLYKLVIIRPLKLQVNFRTNYGRLFILFKKLVSKGRSLFLSHGSSLLTDRRS